MVKALAQIASLPGAALIADPDTISPDMQFGNGTQVNDAPGYFSSLPAIYGPESPWSVLEWNKTEYLNPAQMSQNAPSTYDPLLGNATYSWATPDGESSLYIYGNGSTTPWVYDLRSSGGLLTNGGGSNVFLSDSSIAPGATFNNKITYQLTAKISEAVVSYNNAAASTDGDVLAQAFSGFTLWFNEPGTASFNSSLPSFNVFMQIPLTNSDGSARSTDYRSASPLAGDDGFSLVYGHVLSTNRVLPFAASTGAPQTLSYNLNAYLSDLIAQPWPVTNANGTTSWVWLPSAVDNFSDWTLTSSYVGLETQNADGLPGANPAPQGTAAIGLQVSDLQIASNSNVQESPASFNSQPRDSGLNVSQIESFSAWQQSQSQSQSAQANVAGPLTASANVQPLATANVPLSLADAQALMDPAYLRAMHPNIPAGDNPAIDYMEYGWKLGWNPDQYFNTDYYLKENPTVAASGENPLAQFDATGWQSGANPSDLFNTQVYLAQNPDVAAEHIDPLVQYLETGQAQGRPVFAADPLIDPSYIEAHVAGLPATDDPVADFTNFGWQEGWNPDAYFDVNYYLAQYPEVKAAGVDPLTDYETTGWLLGRNPSASFSTDGYLAANPDVKASGVNPLVQYLEYGIAEGRAAVPVG